MIYILLGLSSSSVLTLDELSLSSSASPPSSPLGDNMSSFKPEGDASTSTASRN